MLFLAKKLLFLELKNDFKSFHFSYKILPLRVITLWQN